MKKKDSNSVFITVVQHRTFEHCVTVVALDEDDRALLEAPCLPKYLAAVLIHGDKLYKLGPLPILYTLSQQEWEVVKARPKYTLLGPNPLIVIYDI